MIRLGSARCGGADSVPLPLRDLEYLQKGGRIGNPSATRFIAQAQPMIIVGMER